MVDDFRGTLGTFVHDIRSLTLNLHTFGSVAEVIGRTKDTITAVGLIDLHAGVTGGTILLCSRGRELFCTFSILSTNLWLDPHVFHLSLKCQNIKYIDSRSETPCDTKFSNF